MESHVQVLLAIALMQIVVCTATNAFNINQQKYKGCHERWEAGERNPGIYTVFPNVNGTRGIQMLCNHTEDGTQVLIQQRIHGTLSFARPFLDYKHGFGYAASDYWAGLDIIYHLTATGYNKLIITLQDWNGQYRSIKYGHFSILDQSQGYRLSIGYPSGNVPDDFSYHNGMYFYTYDYPDQNNCALHMKAGWWYNYCAYAMLNGNYYRGGPYMPPGGYFDGIYWKDWLGFGYSLYKVQMFASK